MRVFLAASYLEHHPGTRFYVLVVDGLPHGFDAGSGVRIIDPDELEVPYFSELCFKYDATELSTSMKPALLNLLLDRYNEETVIYLDPDILVMRRFVELFGLPRHRGYRAYAPFARPDSARWPAAKRPGYADCRRV
jgi:hypothetical protein